MERRGEKRWSRDIITTLSLSTLFSPTLTPSMPRQALHMPAPFLQTTPFPSHVPSTSSRIPSTLSISSLERAKPPRWSFSHHTPC